MPASTTGQIFNIQRYSIHDGAGIRTLVFMKGCPLRCRWCSNPESQKGTPELGFIESICAGEEACGAPCTAACPVEALAPSAEGRPTIDRRICDDCGLCAEACLHGALKLVGREMTVAEVLAEVERDRAFYRRSGGGLTVGGGEPLAQPVFTAALLEAAQAEYLHTAIETSGAASWRHFEKVLRHVDLLQLDLKHVNPARHKELTGRSNEAILENLRNVLSVMEPQNVVIRIPVVPGCNDSVENIRESASLVAELGFTQIELMPYHEFGRSKYGQYGRVYPLSDAEPVSDAELQSLRELAESCGPREVSARM